jgi:hypothetical protein
LVVFAASNCSARAGVIVCTLLRTRLDPFPRWKPEILPGRMPNGHHRAASVPSQLQRITAQPSAVLAPPAVHRGVAQDAVDHFGGEAFPACSKAKPPASAATQFRDKPRHDPVRERATDSKQINGYLRAPPDLSELILGRTRPARPGRYRLLVAA